MPDGTPERQAEHQRTIAMIRRSADGQSSTRVDVAVASWETRLDALDLDVVAATSSTLVRAIPPDTVRPGDLVVRTGDDSFRSYRLISRG